MFVQEPDMPIGSGFLEMYPELCLRGLKEMVSLGLQPVVSPGSLVT